MMTRIVISLLFSASLCSTPGPAAANDEADSQEHSGIIAGLSLLAQRPIASDATQEELAEMLERHIALALRAAGQRETERWKAFHERAEWETYRDRRVRALEASLGPATQIPRNLQTHVTARLEGPGYRVENVVFESRPGLFVTGNLYQPAEAEASMPGMILCHSHHAPKWDEELQQMGIGWARRGCVVLAIDLLGHGERWQHPFRTSDDYPRPFKAGRQDYFFRYNLAIQLQLIGQSLTGWMAWDLMRGVDLLLDRPGVDPERIIILGAVAGGGDVAAVTAALDARIGGAVIFNFGGPQPETRYPLPENAEEWFDYTGSGSWESTRNLPLSARDGFLPWAIVGSLAPRRLVYGHEFSWDQERDPVWSRLERIYGFYGAGENLVGVEGTGGLSGQPPEASHCNNIGPVQLAGIHPAFERWFNIPAPPDNDRRTHSSAELTCMTAELSRQLSPQPVWKIAAKTGQESVDQVRDNLAALEPERRAERLRELWAAVLGEIEPPKEVTVVSDVALEGELAAREVILQVEPGIVVPVLLLLPPRHGDAPVPVVVGIAQEGHRAFLVNRAATIAGLLEGGVAVCLADVRGAGDTRPADDSRGRTSRSTDLSASSLMLGRPLLGQRVLDLRCVLRFLRREPNVDPARIGLWGDSFAPPNGDDVLMEVPYGAEDFPGQSEPMGAIVALLAALYEPQVRAVCGHGGLAGYQSILESAFCYVPHDVIVPGAFTAGDLCDVAAALAPRPLRMSGLVDGRNRLATREELDRIYSSTAAAYREAGAEEHLMIEPEKHDTLTAAWILEHLNP